MLKSNFFLSRAEMSRGLLKPFRQAFVHTQCDSRRPQQQRWSFDEALSHARRRKPRRFQWCAHCKKYDVVANFEFVIKSAVDGADLRLSMREWEFSTGVQ